MGVFRQSNVGSSKYRTRVRGRSTDRRRLPVSLEALENRTLLSTVSWINAAGGDWGTAANWSDGVVPTASQDATINIAVSGPITIDSADSAHSLTDTTAGIDITSGSLSLAATSSISHNVTISGGTLTGSGTVTVDGLLSWTGGTMSGPGTTLAEGGLQLGDAADSNNESLAARTLQNAGSATWASTDTLNQSAGSIFQNLAKATLTVGSGVTWNADNGTLDNQSQATLTVDAGTGTASFNGYFTNEGGLVVSSGTLVLGAGGSVTGGVAVDSGATLQFTGTQYIFNSGASVEGQGTVTFAASSSATIFDSGSSYSFSGTTNIESGATVVFDALKASTYALHQSGGTLGGSGLFTIGSGTTTWTGGIMSGSGITQCLGGTLYLGASGVTGDGETLAGRTLINDGAGVWYGPDILTQEGSSTFLNYSGATLQIVGGGTWGEGNAPDASGTFENNGTVTVTDGSSSTVVQTYFINSGTVEVASGTLQLVGGGACPWNALAAQAGFTVDSGATLLFGNDYDYEAYAFNSGGSISGAGSVTFGTGVSANFGTGSKFNPSGETLIETGGGVGDGVAFTAGSTVGSLGNLTIDSGVVNFSTGATITVASLNLSDSAVLTGSDTLGVSGLLTWIDGTMEGSGTTVAEGGLDLGLDDGDGHDQTLEARTLINEGTAIWVGMGAFNLLAGSTFTNQPNATFDDAANGTMGSDSTSLFDNHGTFVVQVASAVTAMMQSNFNNEGQVDISSGTWELSGDGKSTGTFALAPGASLQLNSQYSISSALITGKTSTNVTTFSGSGTIPTPLGTTTLIDEGVYEETGVDTLSSLDMTDGTLTVTGTLTVVGSMTWTGGYIVGPGTLIVEGGLTLGTDTGAVTEVLAGAMLMNQSTITLDDQDVFAQQDGATVENFSTIDIDGDVQWDGDGAETIDNQGTIEKTAGTGTTTFNYIALVNDGAVTVSSGTLDLEGGGTATGSYTAAAQATLDFGHSSWAFNSTSSVKGAGTVEFSVAYWPSFFNANSIYDVSGATDFESQEPVDFLGGSVENLGAVTLENGTTLDLSSSGEGPAVSADSAASLTESSGAILTGSDQLTVSGQLNWTGGVMSGTGTTIADGTLQMGAPGDTSDVEYLTVRTLEVEGGGTLEPQDTFEQSYGSNFVNTATDTLDIGGGVNWESNGDGTATIDNLGALIVGVEGESVFTAPTIQGGGNFPFLTCPGAIGVYVDGLNLDCDGSATLTLQASFTVLYPCTLQFGGDFTLEDGAGIGGAGNVEVPGGGDLWVTSGASYDVTGNTTIDGGTIEFDDSAEAGTLNVSSGDLTGSGTLTVVAGPTVWTGGTMDGVGNTITDGDLQIGLPSDTDNQLTLDGRTLTNAGTATWAGSGSFSQVDGATFVNQAGATFNIDNGLTSYSNDGTGTIANAGTIVESASGDATTLDAAFDNTGSVQVEQGTLSVEGGSVVGGSYLVLAGATLTFGNDNVTTTSIAVPSAFTAGPLNWSAAFAGTAQDNSGSGLASVGASLFNGQDYYNGTAFSSPTHVYNPAVLSGSSWTYSIETGNFQSDQAYTVASDATDNHGGSEPSTVASVLLAPAAGPAVSTIAPSAGPTAGGTKVTITGLALANATAVDFGTVQGTIVSDTSTAIVVTSPAATAAGSVNVTVKTAGGTSAISSADQFTYVAAPAVSTVAPASGPTAGGTKVTITGLALANATAVDFGTVQGTIVSDTSTAIVVTSPAATAAGSVNVTVKTAEGTSANSSASEFTYTADVPPTSTVEPLAATTTSTSFTVSWSGSDTNGPGIASYSVYVSNDGGAYTPFVTDTTTTSAVFTGQAGHTYAFYSVAADRLGLAQPTPKSAQATITIALPPPVTVKQVMDVTNKQHQVTEVLVTFSGPVNATGPDRTTSFRLATAGRGGSYTAKNATVIKLGSAVYKGATDTVTLTPKKRFALTKPVQLVIYGADIEDSYGRSIDGADNGVTGSNAVAILSKRGATIEALAQSSDSRAAVRVKARE